MDLSLLPDIFSLTAFIVGFRPLVRRVGSHANLWFVGWGLVLIHHLTLMFNASSGSRLAWLNLISIWAIQLCGVVFILISANVTQPRVGRLQTLELALPVLFQSALSTLGLHATGLNRTACLLYLAPALHLLLIPRDRDRPIAALSGVYALLGVATLPFVAGHSEWLTLASLSMLFLAAACLYLTSAERYTRGVIAVVAGLAAWGLSYPLLPLFTILFPDIHLDRVLRELPQYFVVAAVMLVLLEEHVERSDRLALHDPLTDLPNRRLFEERLIAAMEEARLQRTTIACLVIDVDNFKTINDTLGHSAGDQLLRALAVRLSWHMGPRDMLARTGGDEFTALLAGVTDEHHLRFIASAMMSAGSVPVSLDGQPVNVHISIGIALSPDHADDIDGLRRAADQAMYSAKRRGGSLLAYAGED